MNNIKKYLKNILSVLLCGVLISSGVVIAVHATGSKKVTSEKIETKKPIVTINKEEDKDISKDETVYILARADGATKKIIVSDWIKNAMESSTIKDQTELANITNIKGDETYTQDGNTHVWDTLGNDIYYQGDIEKELPVSVQVSYKLDGSPISVDEMAGKSGEVTIRFDYTNHQYKMMNINGKQEKMYVPFTILTGMILDNDNFKNIKISNGKIVNDGDRTILVGMAFPGLSSNLDVDKDTLDIPDYVEVTANVTDFELMTTMTLATNEMFHTVDFNDTNDLDGLSDSLDELTDAMDQLLDGSLNLYEGLDELLDKSGEMKNGINQLTNGAEKLVKGNKDLDSGASKLQSGASELSEGLDTLSSNNASLNASAKQVFESLLSTANSQLAGSGVKVKKLTIHNYASVLDSIISSLNGSPGATEIVSLKKQLDSYNQFYQGLIAYTDGVSKAGSGAKELKSATVSLKKGTTGLKNGTQELSTGLDSLQKGSNALIDGVTQLRDGSLELSDGLKEFNEKGVQKLVDAVDGDIDGLLMRIRKTKDLSKEYKSFAGISDEMDGCVRFIYKTDPIEIDKSNEK